MDFIADNWSSGVFGPDSKIKDEDRVDLLFAMTSAGITSKRVLGQTTNMIIDG